MKKDPVHLDDFHRYDEVMDRMGKEIATLHYDRGCWLLSAGQFDPGWREIKWRFQTDGVGGDYELFPIPVWDGEDLNGKRVFLWMEQGIGDQILCASMIPDLIPLCKKLIIYCGRRMALLLKRSFPEAVVVGPGEISDFSQFDYQMTFSEIGLATRKSFKTFPKRKSFLVADPEKVAAFRRKYEDKECIGVSWRSTHPRIGRGKTIPFDQFEGLLLNRMRTYVSLQQTPLPSEASTHVEYDQTYDQTWDLDTFAAQVAAMDRVVSISNTTLHMAGALGVKALGLLPKGGQRNWYWHNGLSVSPWYPSAALARQETPGEWAPVISHAKAWLDG